MILKFLSTTGIMLAILLQQASPGLAQYQRPGDARPTNRQGTTTTGTRGDGQLIQLTPKSHIGLSTSSHPTFSWFVAEGTLLPGELQLYERSTDGRYSRVLETPHQFVSEPGFMSFTLPNELPGLKPNTTYSWQLVLRNREFPNDIVIQTRSEIEILDEGTIIREPLDSPLTETPLTETSLTETIERLSRSGLWYDALALTLSLPAAESHSHRNSLLIELAEVELSEAESRSIALPAETHQTDRLIAHAQGLKEIASLESEERLSSLLMRLQ